MAIELYPLFPLNTVLFPRMPLPLHIFEDRYKRMINRCLQEEMPFGVLLIQEGSEVGDIAKPESVGTLARIHAVERLDEGEMNLLTEGTQRFRLLDTLDSGDAYLVGRIELMRDAPSKIEVVSPLAEEVTRQFQEYFNILVEHAGVQMPTYELPDDAEELSFVIASVIDTDLAGRQTFLEMTDTVERLTLQTALLNVELARLRLASQNVAQQRTEQRLDAEWRSQFVTKN
jgi:Lon protease-like protein